MKHKLFTLFAALICATTAGAQSVNYIERSWNDRNEAVVNTGMTATTYTTINGGGDVELSAGTYVISGANITVNSLRCKGVVKLILCDDAQLTVNNGIKVNKEDNAELYIYSQSYDASMGKLRVTTTDDDYKGAAIGSSYEKDLGYIEIHGGDIKAEGKTQYYDFANYTAGAGIGSGFNSNGNTIKIYGGKIEAIGYGKECAIGSGGNSKKGCTTSIYDGDITATAYQGAGIGSTAKEVSSTGSVIIYGGKIVAKSSQGAGIGGGDESKADDVTIYGGEVHATGGENCAGIGGSHKHNGTDVTIYGGKVYANGGKYGAGIGSGNENVLSSTHGGWLTVRGGEVYAQGGEGAAGIGGGYRVCGAEVIITGGYIVATGGNNAAGIGGGQEADGNTFTISGGEVHATGGIDGAGIGGGYGAAGGTVTVNGGKVYARGDLAHNANGAGIGSGTEQLTQFGLQSGTFTMTAGYVEAYGGTDAAGIGGGEGADGATVTISGGEVHACGKDYGAGIGGGENGDGGNVTITGGTVFAKAGKNATGRSAIGAGLGSDDNGSLTIGDEMMVTAERILTAAERKDGCWYRAQVLISPCIHNDMTYTLSGTGSDDTHTGHCNYCNKLFTAETHTFEHELCNSCGVKNASSFVKTEAELNAALINGATIVLGADITLNNEVTIDGNISVTIDLYGHKLDRGLGEASTTGGCVFNIKAGSTLTINDSSADESGTITGGYNYNGGGIHNQGTLVVNGGTISGNRASNAGGGIYNFGTATINGGSIYSNTSSGNGGGIDNPGTLTVNDGYIEGNTSSAFGGGIANGNTLNLNGGYIIDNHAYSAGGGIWMGSYNAFNVKGAITVTGNTIGGLPNNVYFADNKVITVTGSLTGSSMGISTESEGTFTSGYSSYNNGVDPTTYFIVDNTTYHFTSVDGEAYLSYGPQGSVYYYERSWDAEKQTVVNTQKTLTHKIGYSDAPSEGDYKEVTSCGDSDDWFALGGFNDEVHEYYVVRGIVSHNTLNVLGKNVHLILCDDAKLTLSGGILLYGDRKLYIHSQSYGASMGKLIAESGYADQVAGIGSDTEEVSYQDGHPRRHGSGGYSSSTYAQRIPAELEIHGGDIYAMGGKNAAGIGGGQEQTGCGLTIYGGKVEGHGGDNALSGAGIGGGDCGDGGTFIIYDGIVQGYGGICGAGIGGGNGRASGTIKIYGGTVYGYGGKYTVGIGSGDTGFGCNIEINGGDVNAYGGTNGAGIGIGENQYGANYSSGTIIINGGTVKAYGGEDGAGIGGGYNCDGADVTINGGYVEAHGDYVAGGNGAGIGSGSIGFMRSYSINGGTLTVTGGIVKAYGGVDAAGIGGGEDADGGTVIISGGEVYAYGNDYAAGIGGGQDGDGGNVTITGGIVVAQAGRNETGCRAIGPGEHSDEYGSLTIGDQMMVSSERKASTAERHDMCWYRTRVRVEPCTHDGATVSIIDGINHSVSGCAYCNTAASQPHAFGDYGECPICHLISLADGADNSAIISHWDSEMGKSVTLSGRTLWKDGAWNTLCLPFDATLTGDLADATLMELDTEAGEYAHITGFENGKLYLNFKTASSIVAGKPYIIKWGTPESHPSSNLTNPTFSNVTISNSVTEVVSTDGTLAFVGAFSPLIIGLENKSLLFLGGNNTLYYPQPADAEHPITIGSCRAHFRLKGIEASPIPSQGGVKEFVLNFGEDDADDINSLTPSLSEGEGAIYNLAGQRLSKMQRGINIVNGKKILVGPHGHSVK